jgi:transcriptional regulator with XRE-family HTH domain
MPAKLDHAGDQTIARLTALGAQLRAHRKALRINATSTAEAAGVSRMTLHRIERGEPSVAMAAYFNVALALGLDLDLANPKEDTDTPPKVRGWIPARVRLADYPELQRLAWHVHGKDALTPAQALGIYERNLRHMDLKALEPRERDLIEALRQALGGASDVR